MVSALALGAILLSSPRVDFFAEGPYDSTIPKPDSILGYAAGSRHTTYREQEHVVLAIAKAASQRIKLIECGKSVEGRPLRIAVIASPENLARIEAIRNAHQSVANGKGKSNGIPPIVWVNETIHGDETASFESGMWLLYNLAASRGGRIAESLKHVVVVLNPVYNPDGHERHVVYYNSVAMGSPDPDAFENFTPGTVQGRLNHYRFDLNRDRISFSQPETRQEFAEFLRWRPQVVIDQHGQVASYFFPPEPQSINANVDRLRNAKWTELFGKETARQFDARGLSYFTKESFDLYYPGYVDSSTTLSGAIGMTHETDGGRTLARKRSDGSVLTLRQGIWKHFTSALAVIETAAKHDDELMADYAKFMKAACDGTLSGSFKRVVVKGDARALARLKEQLASAGVESFFAATGFDQPKAHSYTADSVSTVKVPAGALIVDLAQPQAALGKALLEPKAEFEPEFIKAQIAKAKAAPEGEKYPGPEGPDFYDLTGWSLPYAHGLEAWWCETAPVVGAAKAAAGPSGVKNSSIGYLLPYSDQEDVLAVFEALHAGVRGAATTKAVTVGKVTYQPGTFLFMAERNEEGYERKLAKVVAKHGGTLLPLTSGLPDDGPSLGSETVQSLHKPSIALVMGRDADLADVSGAWFLMDQVFHLPFTPISADSLNSPDLSRFTCVVIPAGVNPGGSKFKEWISAGNTAVVLGGGTAGLVELTEAKGEPKSLPGGIFRAEMDSRSRLSYGYARTGEGKITIPVPVDGGSFYQARKEGGSVITFADEKTTKLLSGWVWPDDTEKNLAGTVWLQDVAVGQGHAVLFLRNPLDRAMWPGLHRLFLNALLFG